MAAKGKKTRSKKIYVPEYFGGEDGLGLVGPPKGPAYLTEQPGWGEYPAPLLDHPPGPPDPRLRGLPDPGYEVQVSPQTRVILQGRTASYTILILPGSDFRRDRMFFAAWPSSDNLRNNARPWFSLNPIGSFVGSGPFPVTFSITTQPTIPLDLYGFNITIVQMPYGIAGITAGGLVVTRLYRPTLKAPPVD